MALSVMKELAGPDWPLGLIAVVTPGTPVGIMSLVDPNAYNDPSTASSTSSYEYTVAAQQIFFQAVKAGASHGVQNNTGNIYIVRYASRTVGGGNRDDYGVMVWTLTPGANIFLSSAPLERNVFSPYRYYIDADNSGDSALVTLLLA
jgi:hypothetical protein